jgi:hypothetical protein
MIPDEVARLADEAYYDIAGGNPTISDELAMKHAIAAALNAWPGRALAGYAGEACHILPLPQEPQ